MKGFFGLFTDSKDRPEIKAVTGVVFIIAALVWLFWKGDVAGALAVAGFGTGLLFAKTIEDAKLDKGA
jgi:hypothetical protein